MTFMWPFARKTLCESGFFNCFSDEHSHILPGVDDGIQTVESSLQALDFLEGLGVGRVCCTPHIMEDYPNESEKLKETFESLKSAYKGKMELDLSAEYMMDNLLSKRLDDEDLLPYGKRKGHLLVETSYFRAPGNMDALLEKVRSCGLIPVLAHPERYTYMSENKLYSLYDSGVKLQMNVVSLTGCYSHFARKRAQWLYECGMYDFYGTDLHSLDVFKERINSKIRIQL